jgi:xanthine dehydrogenase iron-sulfur cluster and FAD-binding subunit A
MTCLRKPVPLSDSGGEKTLVLALNRVHDLAILDYRHQAMEIGAGVTRNHGHHRAEFITARVPTRKHYMFSQHLNVDIRGVAVENAVPIAIASRRVIIY